jgi:short subunit fatty acids transporter
MTFGKLITAVVICILAFWFVGGILKFLGWGVVLIIGIYIGFKISNKNKAEEYRD